MMVRSWFHHDSRCCDKDEDNANNVIYYWIAGMAKKWKPIQTIMTDEKICTRNHVEINLTRMSWLIIKPLLTEWNVIFFFVISKLVALRLHSPFPAHSDMISVTHNFFIRMWLRNWKETQVIVLIAMTASNWNAFLSLRISNEFDVRLPWTVELKKFRNQCTIPSLSSSQETRKKCISQKQ